jgi:hypothetical protein
MGVRSFVMGIFDWVYEEPQLRENPFNDLWEPLVKGENQCYEGMLLVI